ncbi:12093_t:CDS:1, partial [Cetraspora pellucida]
SSTNCCHDGKVVLAPLGSAPVSILRILTENSPTTGDPYLRQIRLFNSVFTFTSMGASIDPDLVNETNGVYTYRIHGAIYHRIGSLLPSENCIPKFSQIYIYDGNFEVELNRCHNVFPNLDCTLLADIQHDLHIHNPFVQIFCSAGQFVCKGRPVVLKILSGQGHDIQRYNRPTANEVAVLLIDNSTNSGHDIILQTTQSQLQRISECHAAYDAL